ncbi:hypothetical protein GCM10011369_11430 [Neiella marina]|uniref:Uncharacterized protein n=1 Tax=Neiella marina TaxID=508461 RepID=A0A8J2XN91_9GAMM|nr:hypothetical protein [Neiella marina]GGA71367.1 hypothetical protein GCM10011369_11430 [Neiella marina]
MEFAETIEQTTAVQSHVEYVDVIDIEASGFGRGSYPVEIGVCRSNGECRCYLIKPESDWTHWTTEAEKTHGISRQLLHDNGRDVREVALELNEFLRGCTVYTDAWGQDQSWLMRLYDAANCWPSFKLETIRNLMTEPQSEHYHQSYQQAAEELNLKRHRASTDAKVIQHALAIMQANSK